MRLKFHMHASSAPKQLCKYGVTFSPLEDGLENVSYYTLLWEYHGKKYLTNLSGIGDAKWINFCLYCGELEFIKDLQSRGFDTNALDMNQLRSSLREELLMHITQIELKQSRNTTAHVFGL
ncbi:hypothetical protein O6H91_Y238400 [Diphasiastrum complanatum]|nr:hypothetical protein O6H91_Y238400 [Diphasiastrum complanatum]